LEGDEALDFTLDESPFGSHGIGFGHGHIFVSIQLMLEGLNEIAGGNGQRLVGQRRRLEEVARQTAAAQPRLRAKAQELGWGSLTS